MTELSHRRPSDPRAPNLLYILYNFEWLIPYEPFVSLIYNVEREKLIEIDISISFRAEEYI